MNVNERIARALGWLPYRQANPQIDWASMPDYSAGWGWQSPEGKREAFVPDYAHSLDACLPVLADKEKDGWQWQAGGAVYPREGSNSEIEFKFWAVIMVPGQRDITSYGRADSPAAALAECLAEALERGAVTFPRASTADKEKAR